MATEATSPDCIANSANTFKPSSPTTLAPLSTTATTLPPTLMTFPTTLMTTPVKPTLSARRSLSSTFEPLSSAEILERVPTPVIRLIASLGPLIHAVNRLIRLVTWTAGPDSASSSMLLLVGWWLVCSFGYEVLRYAPQTLVLSWIAYTWVGKHLTSVKSLASAKSEVISAETINATLLELSELTDFVASFKALVLLPIARLLSWDPSPSNTKAVVAFVILTWPLWLVVFLPWDSFKLPSIQLPVSPSAIVSHVCTAGMAAKHLILAFLRLGPFVIISEKLSPLFSHYDVFLHYISQTPLPVVYHWFVRTLSGIRIERWTSFTIMLFPPYPIGALSVRSLLCIVGTIAFTWCSPWCALLRQAIWKSATVRRIIRGTGRVLSGQTAFSEAYGRGNLDDEWKSGALTEESLARSQSVSGKRKSVAADAKDGQNGSDDSGGVTRHEDVIYKFSIFENQRWWVGLDWTAALLPQERPSWSDEANNPVSPPSSFSLPLTRTTLTSSPTPSNPKACTRRTVRWQWLDSEWTVAGATHTLLASSAAYKASLASKEAAKPIGEQDSLCASKQGYLGDALNRIRNVRASSLSSAAEEPLATSSSVSELGATPSSGIENDQDWDVDAEGWQYGDNAWEKMSKKAGLGRYTRRRKWVRRAVLVEIVEKGVDGPAPTERKPSNDQVKGEEEVSKSDAASDDKSPTIAHPDPTSEIVPSVSSTSVSPSKATGSGRQGLKERLAKVAH